MARRAFRSQYREPDAGQSGKPPAPQHWRRRSVGERERDVKGRREPRIFAA